MRQPTNLTWDADVSLITHPVMLANFAKILVLSGSIMTALLCFMMAINGEWHAIGAILELTGICLSVVAVLFVVVALVVFRNRMHMRFRLDDKSVGVEVIDTRAKTASKIAAVAGALAGKPGVAGAGLIAMSTTTQTAVWSSIARARYHPAWHAILLSNGWRTVINLFCTPENYAAVAAAVHDALAAQLPRKRRKSPLPMMLLRTVLVTAACVPLFFLPDADASAKLPALLTLAFALATVWLIPLASWAVCAGLGWLAAIEAIALNEVHTSIFGETSRNYEMLDGDEQAALAFAAIGTAYLIWLGVGFLRGKIRSGLAGDMADMSGDE
jgi:hypothetical protein